MSTTKKKKSTSSSLLELVLIVATALALALGIQAFLVKPYRIPSESMEPTLQVGQRVLVNRIGTRFSDPGVGDILVFHPPQGSEDNRCGVPPVAGRACVLPTPLALGRQLHQARGGRSRRPDRDRRRPRDPQRQARHEGAFTRPCTGGEECNFPKTFTVPQGYYFMMGDNRGSSDDSRFWGPVPKKWIIGAAFATYWPPGRIGIL